MIAVLEKKKNLLFHTLYLSKIVPHVHRIFICFTNVLNTWFWLVKGKLSEKPLILWYIKRYTKLHFQGKKTRSLPCLFFTLEIREHPVREHTYTYLPQLCLCMLLLWAKSKKKFKSLSRLKSILLYSSLSSATKYIANKTSWWSTLHAHVAEPFKVACCVHK